MLNFGKSRTGRKGLIGTRRFDTLIGVGPRVVNDTYDPAEYDRFMRSLTVSGAQKKVMIPKRDDIEVHLIKRDYRDLDLELDDDDVNYGFVRRSLRENRGFNARMNELRKIRDLQEKFWWMDRTAAEQQISDERRNKPKPRGLGDLFLESNPDGEEKIARKETRQQKVDRSKSNMRYRMRNGLSWKNKSRRGLGCHSDHTYNLMNEEKEGKIPGDDRWIQIWEYEQKNFPNHASKQWARHKPKFHCAWTIGEETCATFLVWQRQDEEWEREYNETIARDMDRENEAEMRASHNDACYEAECDALEVLECLYRKGDWCVEDDVEVNPELDQIDMMERHFDKGFRVYQRAA